jgi:argininosuccinate lyase
MAETRGTLTAPIHPLVRASVYGPPIGTNDLEELRHFANIDAAHAAMLSSAGLLSLDQLGAIFKGLAEIGKDDFAMLQGRPKARGLFSAYERGLAEFAGEAVDYLHLGRSRNDINATLGKIKLRKQAMQILRSLCLLQARLVRKAEHELGSFLPMQTHFQLAYPATLGFYLSGVATTIDLNIDWLIHGLADLDECPMGACAGGGTSVPIQPGQVAQLLGFARGPAHPLAAVASRDTILRFASALSIVHMTLGRLATDLLGWLAGTSRLVELPEALLGASSIMPQKRNPFVLEHIRARLDAAAMSFAELTLSTKSTPFTNSIEAGTEAVASFFDRIRDVQSSYLLLGLIVDGLKVNGERAMALAAEAAVGAAVTAEQRALCEQIPFRRAHQEVAAHIAGAVSGESITLLSPIAAGGLMLYGAGMAAAEEHRAHLLRLRHNLVRWRTLRSDLRSVWLSAQRRLDKLQKGYMA